MPRGISAARSGTTTTAAAAGSSATLERASPTAGVLWKSSPYQFIVNAGGLTIQMQVANSWIAVTSVPVSVVEQFLMTRGLIKPMTSAPVHTPNGANRVARVARAPRQAKTTTASRA